MTFIVGLTGGIGSGKSTVAQLFVQRGAALIDTDVIAHELTGPQGAAMDAISAAFGQAVLRVDGSLDRAAMRHLVFSEPLAKARLEAILHPLIRAESLVRCAAAGSVPYVILDIPLLIELGGGGGYHAQIDRILVVDCAEAVQISRVVARSGLAVEAIRAIIATQATRAERRAMADDWVSNDDGLHALEAQVALLHLRYLELAVITQQTEVEV